MLHLKELIALLYGIADVKSAPHDAPRLAAPPIDEPATRRLTWVERPVLLKSYLGEIQIHAFEFPAMVLSGVCFAPSTEPSNVDAIRQIKAGINTAVVLSEPVRDSWKRISFREGVICYKPGVFPHYYIRVDGSFANYLQNNFRAKPRHNLLRSVKQFAEHSQGSIDFRTFRRPDEVSRFHELGREVSRLTYQERVLKGGLPNTDEFREQLMEEAERGIFRGYVLLHEDRPIAYAYCRIEGDVILYQTIGYDPAYQYWSPGKILLYFILKRVFDTESVTIFDFGSGEAHYKALFSNADIRCVDVYYFRKSPGNLAKILLHATVDSLSGFIGRVLGNFGLRQSVRKLLRRLAIDRA